MVTLCWQQLARIATSLNKFPDQKVDLRCISGLNAPVDSHDPVLNIHVVRARLSCSVRTYELGHDSHRDKFWTCSVPKSLIRQSSWARPQFNSQSTTSLIMQLNGPSGIQCHVRSVNLINFWVYLSHKLWTKAYWFVIALENCTKCLDEKKWSQTWDEMRRSKTDTRPRRWALCPRRNRYEMLVRLKSLLTVFWSGGLERVGACGLGGTLWLAVLCGCDYKYGRIPIPASIPETAFDGNGHVTGPVWRIDRCW